MKKMFYCFLVVLSSAFCTATAYSQTLIMNEVSNGPAGNQEYVEFVVSDTVVAYNCNSLTPPCIDIRGWIFDDNSGYHGAGGVAVGAVRFSFDPLWACIPLGTIIVIYNDADPNPSMPANDISLSDGNCSIIAPISNTALFEQNGTTPGAIACSYPATGWLAGGTWSNTILANTGDCARIVNLAGCEVFSVCWAANNLNNLIYFNSGGSGSQNVWFFNNGNPNSQANWSEGSTTIGGGVQTPGLPNNLANAAYISQFNNSCTPITPLIVSTPSVTNAGCTCSGTATAAASGSISGYTYEWLNASFVPIGQTTATAIGLCAGIYHVIATSSIGCSDTATITISAITPPTVSVNNQTICAGTSTTLTATPSNLGGTYSWSPGGETTQTITINPLINTNYTVTYTQGDCIVTNNGLVTANPLPIVVVSDQTVCAGTTITLSGNGAASYSWDNGVLDGISFIPITTTNYTVTGTSAEGCINTDQVLVTVNPLPTVSAGGNQIVCAGTPVTLSGSGADSYSWNIGVSDGVAFIPTITANYTVTGTAANGCIATDQVTVTVNSLPIVSGGVNQTVCAGTAVTLSGSGATTYSWDNGVLNGTAFFPTTTATYTVTGTAANGCINTDLVLITVNSLPIVSGGGDQAVCAGNPITLSGTGASTYAWDNGITNGISFVPAATATYTVTGTDANGCFASDQVVITVNPIPIVDAGLNQTVCAGSQVTLTGSGATSYSWNNGASNGVSFIPTSTTTYTVTGTAANGCFANDQVIITVNPIPVIDAGVNQIVCAGTTVTLTGTGGATLTWNNGVTNGVSFIPTTTTTYTLTGTSANGCSASDQVIVTVNALPIINAGVDQTICEGDAVTLIASGATTYTWNNGVTNGISFTPANSGTYSVTGTDANGCINSDIVTINILPIPTANVIADVTTGDPGLVVNFTNNSSNGTTYNWVFGNGQTSTLSTLIGQTITYSESGTYTVSLTASNGVCSDVATVQIIVSALPPPVILVPNVFTPNQDGVNDEFFIETSFTQSIKLFILNRWGEVVFETTSLNSKWNGDINGKEATDGVYFYKYEVVGINSDVLIGHGNITLIR
jgi:gliding motility-associated-like protein